jgi:RNA polymerase sigma-70 factor (ECF subfamily)
MNEKANELSDEDLMALYQSGDVEAFEILYVRHSGKVFDFLQKKTGPQNARDLLQETFLKFHRSRHQYSVQYPFLPWLFAITRNVFVDFVRLNETKVAKASVDTESPLVSHEPEPTWSDELAHALKVLPPNQRRAIELRYLSEWTFEKIAREMKTTPINARQMISRSLKKIRSGLGGSNE